MTKFYNWIVCFFLFSLSTPLAPFIFAHLPVPSTYFSFLSVFSLCHSYYSFIQIFEFYFFLFATLFTDYSPPSQFQCVYIAATWFDLASSYTVQSILLYDSYVLCPVLPLSDLGCFFFRKQKKMWRWLGWWGQKGIKVKSCECSSFKLYHIFFFVWFLRQIKVRLM